MKRILISAFLCPVIIFQLHAQEIAKKENPDEQIIINKEYDENGNLIQYDSTYIHHWSSDSTFNFSFDDKFSFGNGFTDINNLLQEFFGDSLNSEYGINKRFPFSPFDDEEFFRNFNHQFNDSILIGSFPFDKDSVFKSPFDFKNQFPPNINFFDWEELQKKFDGFNFPEFKSLKQKEEWEKLIEKHQKEKEELMKKWDKQK